MQTVMMQVQKFIHAKQFDGDVQLTNFDLQDEQLPELKDNGINLNQQLLYNNLKII